MRARRRGSPGRLLATAGLLLAALTALGAAPCLAQPGEDLGELAKKIQNPVSDLVSLPFQNNLNFGVGPERELQYVLNIQPVVPFRLSGDWTLITRTIVPLVSQPVLAPGIGDVFGLGDIQLSLVLSPAKPGALIWGAGPVVQFPSATDDSLGTGKWALGPTVVALTIRGPWVMGVLVNNLWSVAGDGDRQPVKQMLLQPLITANWEAGAGDRWTVPIGGGLGKIFHAGRLPVNASVGAFANVVRPDAGPDWTLRVQVQFLFPK